MNYTHTTIKLACSHVDGKQCSIDAYVDDSGLCYHKTHHLEGNGPTWSVSHVKSGKVLCQEATQFKTAEQCERFIVRVEYFADWSAEKPAISEDMKANIRRVAVDTQYSSYTRIF